MTSDGIIKVLFGLLLSILGYMGIDALKRINHLERTTVSKDDMGALLKRLADEHGENRQSFRDVMELIQDQSRRIDDALASIPRDRR